MNQSIESTPSEKRIVIINRYFWPETLLVNYISQWLVKDGFPVTVKTGQPDYNPDANIPTQPRKQKWNGVEIERVPLLRDKGRGMARNLNMQMFSVIVVFQILFSRNVDSVWCTTIPPVLQPWLLRLVTKIRDIKFVYFVQDIHPEMLISSKILKPGFTSKLLRRMDNYTLRKSDRVVTISNDMKQLLLSFGANPDTCSIIKSFSTEDADQPFVSGSGAVNPVVFVFAGNLGQFQNLDALVQVFSQCDPKMVQLKFLGNGREKAHLVEYVKMQGISNIEFHDVLPAAEAFEFICGCDVGVVTLGKDIYKYAFPAKTYTYLGAGLPILGFVEEQSELSNVVTERKIGQCVPWESELATLIDVITDVARNIKHYRKNVKKGTDDLWKQERGKQEWLELFNDLSDEHRSDNHHG